jgi:hypothetical protein
MFFSFLELNGGYLIFQSIATLNLIERVEDARAGFSDLLPTNVMRKVRFLEIEFMTGAINIACACIKYVRRQSPTRRI